MRKHVTPADPAATIPDPARGDSLPPEGRPVTWSAHWCGLAMRGDVLVEDMLADEPVPLDEAFSVPVPDPSGSTSRTAPASLS